MDKWWWKCEDRLMVHGVSCGVSAELGYVYDAEGLNAKGATSWMPYVSMTANQCRRFLKKIWKREHLNEVDIGQ